MMLIILLLMLTADTADEERCVESLGDELSKQVSLRDNPRLKKLFRATFTSRRNVVIVTEDGAVQALIEKFPLLGSMEFVSIIVFSLCNVTRDVPDFKFW